MLKELSAWAVSHFEDHLEDHQSDSSADHHSVVKRWLQTGATDIRWCHWGGTVLDGSFTEQVGDSPHERTALWVAMELSARVGMSLLFQRPSIRQTASIVTFQVWWHGLRKGCGAEHMAKVWARALNNGPWFSTLNGVDFDMVWSTLNHWSEQCVAAERALPATWDVPNLLSTARFGLGDVWYASQVRFVEAPVSLEWLTVVQSVEEILRRHLKAASKRLRIQQIERIRILAPHCLADSETDFRNWIAKYVLTHEWSSEHLDLTWNLDNAPLIQELIHNIEIEYAPHLTEQLFSQMLTELPDFFVGVTVEQMAQVSNLPIHWTSLRSHKALRKAIQGCAYASGHPTQAQLDAFELHFPIEVRLMTTRGGTWPERRERIDFL